LPSTTQMPQLWNKTPGRTEIKDVVPKDSKLRTIFGNINNNSL
jgi:hypothetical protein